MGLFDTLRCEHSLPDGSTERDFQTKSLGCTLVSVSLPDAMALPPGVAASAHALWSQRVLLQSDPRHIDTLVQHLLATLPATATSP